MEKKFVITLTKTAVIPLLDESEAQEVARILVDRECKDNFAGNLLYITSEVKELEYAGWRFWFDH